MGAQRAVLQEMPERYSRHAAVGFDQSALAAPLVLISARECAGLGDDVATRLTAMGVERVVIGSRSPLFRDLKTIGRAWRLNPSVVTDNTTIALARQITGAFAGPNSTSLPYVLVDLSERASDIIAELEQWPDVPKLYYAQKGASIAVGHSPGETWSQLTHSAARGTELSGAQHVLAACHVIGDYLAAARAYRSPIDGWMPRAQQLASFEAAAMTTPVTGQTVMLVGGGGALGHALLEAMLCDPALRRTLEGGRIILVDPDHYSESNLSRQTLAGGVENVARDKAVVTAEELAHRWPGPNRPQLLADTQAFRPDMIDWYRPNVVALVADNFMARSLAFDRARRFEGTLVLCGGTEFTYGQTRAVVVGRHGACLDHGPEQLWSAAQAEAAAEAQRASCGREITPSNVLTNSIAGALLAGEWRRHVSGWRVSPSQTLINWAVPQRVLAGPPLPACSCWGQGGDGR